MSVALPIPEPRADDDEDVHWALSTASALWARGESQEALKWLRRAAETASDVNRDMRALELFKAAADFTGRIQAAATASSGSLPALGSPPPPMPVSVRPASQAPSPPAPPKPDSAAPPAPRTEALPGSTMTSQQARAASEAPPAASGPRSAPPPPPPRGRAAAAQTTAMPATSFPTSSVGRALPAPTGIAIGEERIEPMAPTVLGPPQAQPKPAATAERPFVARAAATLVAGRGLDTKAAKTLASNLTYGNMQRAEQEAFRAAVSKASTITDAQAREIANLAARQASAMIGRATHPGVGPASQHEPAPATQLMPPQSHPPSAEPDTAPVPRVGTKPAAQASERAAPTPSRSPSKRRATLRRQGPNAKQEPAIRESNRIPEARPTQRFEEEITIERDLSHIRGQIGDAQAGHDLDESTNVLTGQELDVEVLTEPPAATGAPRKNGARPETDAAEAVTTELRAARVGATTAKAPAASLDGDVDSSTDTGSGQDRAPLTRPAGLLATGYGGLSAFRIALASDAASGVVEATLLAPGEPIPAGRITAIVVAVDATSSSALAELFAKSSSTRKGTRS